MSPDRETGYEIRVVGVIDNCWGGSFPRLRFEYRGDDTVIVAPIADQTALHGVLDRIRDLGLTLVSVRQVGPPPPEPEDLM